MKTRIKITEHKDGTKVYTAQYKVFFCWEDFSWYGCAHLNALCDMQLESDNPKTISLQFAQMVIDNHLELLENERKSADARKIVSVKYVKYP